MNRVLVVLLIVSVIGNVVGAYATMEFLRARKKIGRLQQGQENMSKTVDRMAQRLDAFYSTRLVFLHHSVGEGILNKGGLRDSLFELGVSVKGATYGDKVGQETDIRHWVPKFQRNMEQILGFKAHPDQYYTDGTTNDIVMFKSCYPNSHIVEEGNGPGIPTDERRTSANYRAVFQQLQTEMARYPDKLFIYLTAPPLVPKETSTEAAGRARDFNTWLQRDFLPIYRTETGLDNFHVFDLFDVLADSNNILKECYRTSSSDSHPNTAGSREAAAKFMEFFRPLMDNWNKTS